MLTAIPGVRRPTFNPSHRKEKGVDFFEELNVLMPLSGADGIELRSVLTLRTYRTGSTWSSCLYVRGAIVGSAQTKGSSDVTDIANRAITNAGYDIMKDGRLTTGDRPQEVLQAIATEAGFTNVSISRANF